MYFPPKFNRTRAIELCKLVDQAYTQFGNFKQSSPWQLQGDYKLVSEIFYHTVFSFGVGEEEDTTVIDQEVEAADQVSFGLLDSLAGKDIPMGFVATQGKSAYLVFRGTVTVREWLFDAGIGLQPYRLANWGKVSDGFTKIYQRCRESFMSSLNGLGPDSELFIAGHSLGGALCTLAVPDVIKSTPFKAPQVYTYGCPRVGDKDFAGAYDALPKTRTFRVVNTCDLVPSLPLPVEVPVLPSGNYTHVGIPVDFTYQGNSLGANHATGRYIAELGG